MIIRLVTEVGLIGKVVAYVKIVAESNHTFVILINMPVVLREDDFTNLAPGVIEDGQEASALDEGWSLHPSEFEAGGAQVDHAD